ncbi:uncharacterized protein B0I36DRAFT_366379 [Microdochium trichocladiopsis]|uniref:NAD(P)-binding domain-containing protein n=1 Tax=Microdochium trichocladiopsis TaxID=1682393 RepID=A0A9P8XWC4_9PEZI|nr:uncharacterized protein B0I36DRAFT_366379 [Microdochium trichocladiopsis]KAH7024434.1 hypothetical protein B0I36DRAFT_366379 [Microdochium trichocladiopsis]
MPTYAILGAPGQVGGHVLQTLLKRQDVHIRAFVRSRAKVEKQRPELTTDVAIQKRVSFFAGDITDVDVPSPCLKGADAAFLCVAAAASQPAAAAFYIQL